MRIHNKFGHIVKQMAIFYEPIPYWVTSFIEAPLEEEDTDSKTNRYLDKHIAESCWTFVLGSSGFFPSSSRIGKVLLNVPYPVLPNFLSELSV
jgi:hypothetical protein